MKLEFSGSDHDGAVDGNLMAEEVIRRHGNHTARSPSQSDPVLPCKPAAASLKPDKCSLMQVPKFPVPVSREFGARTRGNAGLQARLIG